MLNYHNIDPVAFSIGPLKIRWYGISYVLSFICVLLLGFYKINRAKRKGFFQVFDDKEEFSDLIFYGAIGVIIGGRLGQFLFYDYDVLFSKPIEVLKIWQGGMSFHGGLIGALISMLMFAKIKNKNFFDIGDFIAPIIPVGLGIVRIANFINGELWGRVTDVPWAMVFPYADALPRHPSQLYESFFEGFVLFLILWFYTLKPKPRMAPSGLFLLFYGFFRFSIEFFREPDGIFFNIISTGQLLSLPMILIGGYMIYYAYSRKNR